MREDTLCHDSMTETERHWLRENRPEEARSDLVLALSRYRAQGHTPAVASCLGDLGRRRL